VRPVEANFIYATGVVVMSIHACRDARCNGTLSVPDPRSAPGRLKYRQVQCVSILQLSFSQHVTLWRWKTRC
jgi:hypothetical protein